MASYNRIKAQKASPIGTIMPWTGSSSTSDLAPDAIPRGWIVMRGQQLRAIDYPLLAQTLGNLYGPTVEPGQPFVGISNNYPNYDEDDVFTVDRDTGNGIGVTALVIRQQSFHFFRQTLPGDTQLTFVDRRLFFLFARLVLAAYTIQIALQFGEFPLGRGRVLADGLELSIENDGLTADVE